jgi:hypothetical protein
MGKLGRPTRDKSAWWVTGRKKDGKMALLGPFSSSDEADSILFDAFPNDTGERFYVGSVDRSKVTQILKFKLFSESHDLDGSMQPISHIK